MVCVMETVNGANPECNGKSTMVSPENGSEIGGPKLLIDSYVVESLDQDTTIKDLQIFWSPAADDRWPETDHSDSSCLSCPVVSSPQQRAFIKYSESWRKGACYISIVL